MQITARVFIIGALGLFVGGWFAHNLFNHSPSAILAATIQVRQDSPQYHFINPLIYTDNSKTSYPELDPLENKFSDFILNEEEQGLIGQASVYFRDMNSGAWTGSGEDNKYVPSSILKVATLMTYLKLAEDNPSILNTKLYYQKNPADRQNYPPKIELADGNYSVTDLLYQMIVYSDNAANTALVTPRERELTQFFQTLHLPLPSSSQADETMSPRDVSYLFRTLYNSTYLVDPDSEQALTLLSQTTFTQGLVAGVPAGTQVAHKFGEHTVYYIDSNSTPDYQLHDCGIVYYPGKPYFICVMTRGRDLTKLEETISQLSSMAYSFVDKGK